MSARVLLRCSGLFLVLVLLTGDARAAAQIATLTRANASQLAPEGAESDWIYGDIVLRSDRLTVVIARPVEGRDANWVLTEVGCSVLDFTQNDRPHDSLGLLRPGGSDIRYRPAPSQSLDLPLGPGNRFRCIGTHVDEPLGVELEYRLGDEFLEIDTQYTNAGKKPLDVEVHDQLRAEETFEKPGDATGVGRARLFFAYDRFAGQAYGVTALGARLHFVSDWRNSELFYAPAQSLRLAPGESHRVVRRLFVARDLIALRAAVARARGVPLQSARLRVVDPAGPVAGADVTLFDAKDRRLSVARSDVQGMQSLEVVAGRYRAEVAAPGRGARSVSLELPGAGEVLVELPAPGVLEVHVVDGIGEPLPAKIQFVGVDGTATPDFGPAQGDHAVRNVYNSHDGFARRELMPGRYRLVVSRGPEYDAFQGVVDVVAGETRSVEARLPRSVDTRGWVSADLHTHSTESGDTTASRLGRVLNLLTEHIEFAPSTQHNRIGSYAPQIAALNAQAWMASAAGVEMTGDFPMNHQNAFPLIERARTQDGGAPRAADPVAQVRRLRLLDDGSEKLVQQNHPDFFQILYDRDRDGSADGGYADMLRDIDVIEIYPLAAFLNEEDQEPKQSPMRLWLQLLNRGVRLPATINTDAHSNFHGAGPRRTYIRSSTDHPGAIAPLEVVRELKRGHAVMTSGPFLEVAMQAKGDPSAPIAIPGDDLIATGGEVELTIRVQCPNWFDIDRVQLLLNGRAAPDLNFTRAKTPQFFSKNTVRFATVLPLSLEVDTHVVVVAAGQQSKLGIVMGRQNAGIMPIAVSNPIFVDVDGGGFQPNFDRLDIALPDGAQWPSSEPGSDDQGDPASPASPAS